MSSKIKVKFNQVLKKIQALPEKKRKIILWSVVILLSLGLFIFWGKALQKKLKILRSLEIKEQLEIPKLQEKIKEGPKIEMPKLSEEEVKKWEEELKKLEEIQKEERD